jgi:PleD family two-component response regulator
VTISLGVVTFAPGRYATPEAMFEEADRCLYLAKQRGRNRVESPFTSAR